MRIRRSLEVGAVVFLGLWGVPDARGMELLDDFEDNNHVDGVPATWVEHSTCLHGTYRSEDGKLILGDNVGELVGTWVDRELEGNVSVRARASSTASGNISCLVHATLCNAGYWAGVNVPSGNVWLGYTVGGFATTLVSGTLVNPPAIGEEIVVQLDVAGGQLEFRAWRPDEPAPEEPTLKALDSRFTSGWTGVYYEPLEIGSEGIFESIGISNQVPPDAAFTISVTSDQAPVEISVDASSSAAEAGREIIAYAWDFGDGSVAEGVSATHTFAEAGLYAVKLTVTDDVGLTHTTFETVSVSCPPGDTGDWIGAAIGEPSFSGSARVDDALGEPTVHVCVGGDKFSASADDGFLLHQEFSGGFALEARVVEVLSSGAGCKVGLMIRESLEPGARAVGLLVEPTSTGARTRIRFYQRRETDGLMSAVTVLLLEEPRPVWLRLERRGDTVTALSSLHGHEWSEAGSQEIEGLADTLLGGVGACNGLRVGGISDPSSRASLTGLSGGPLMPFRRGDADTNGILELTDAVHVLDYLFLGSEEPSCLDACDTDDDGSLDITDPIGVLGYLFLGGQPPPDPGAATCGTDPTADGLDCVDYPDC